MRFRACLLPAICALTGNAIFAQNFVSNGGFDRDLAGWTVSSSAAPDASSRFLGWSGDCSGTGDCIVRTPAINVTAAFERVATVRPVLFIHGFCSGSTTCQCPWLAPPTMK
jgi:hypothetical protein